MTEWNERVAVITGGASGIGLGMARAFGARGMKLVLADLDGALLQEASEEVLDELEKACCRAIFPVSLSILTQILWRYFEVIDTIVYPRARYDANDD